MSTSNHAIQVAVGPSKRGGGSAGGPAAPGGTTRVQTPPIDIFEEPDGLVLLADLPGVAEGSVSIELEDNLLTLRAEARAPVPDGSRAMLEESPIGAYQRTFILSDEVDRSRISAELRHGVLRIAMPRAERARPRRIEIKGLDGQGPTA